MPDESFAFEPSDMISKTEVVSDAASAAQSKAGTASAAAASATSKASDATSKATVAQSKASDVSSVVAKLKRVVILKPYAEGSAISTGDGKGYFTIPSEFSGMNLVTVGAHLYTVGSGLTQVQLHNVISGVDILTSKIEIDTGEKDSKDAASAAVINTDADGVAEGEEIRVDIDAAASAAKGLEIRLGFQKP